MANYNLKWPGVRDHRYNIIHVRPKGQSPDTTHRPRPARRKTPKARYLSSGLGSIKYFVEEANRTSVANHSALFADNDFLKKSRMLSDIINHPAKHHSFTTVLVIASVFLFVTITITAAIVVFCRKRNSVFALQKSEQEDDGEYELDELNTDVEYTETDFESEVENVVTRRKSYPQDAQEDCHRLLGVPGRDPFHGHQTCHCQHGYDPRGEYHKMVIAAILEKQCNARQQSDSEDSCAESDTQQRRHHQRHHRRKRTQDIESDLDSDQELLNSTPKRHKQGSKVKKSKVKNREESEHTQCKNCMNVNNNCSLKTGTEHYPPQEDCHKHFIVEKYQPKANGSSEACSESDKCNCKSCSLYVELPDKSKSLDSNKATCFVDLPPKNDCHGQMHGHWTDNVGKGSNEQCIIDLHPTDMRPPANVSRPVVLQGFQSNTFHTTPNNLMGSLDNSDSSLYSDITRVAVRSRSVTDSLSDLSHANRLSTSELEPQSCPQTPLAEDLPPSSVNNDPMVYFSHAYDSPFYPQSQNGSMRHDSSVSRRSSRYRSRDSATFRAQTSSTASVDQDMEVGFVLSNPYSSVLSLARDNYPNCFDTACEEIGSRGRGKACVSYNSRPQQEIGDKDKTLVTESLPTENVDDAHLCPPSDVQDSHVSENNREWSTEVKMNKTEREKEHTNENECTEECSQISNEDSPHCQTVKTNKSDNACSTKDSEHSS